MSFTNFAARRILNSFLGGGTSPNAPNFGALSNGPTHLAAADDSATPTETGANFNEPVGNGYNRVALSLPGDFIVATDADPSLIENAAAVTFPAATGAGWGTITHVGLFDAASGGNLLYLLALDTNRTINASETLSFSAGELELTLD